MPKITLDRFTNAQAVYLVDPATGDPYAFVQNAAGGLTVTNTPSDLDTDGNAVPTNKAHTYTYDDSGNLSTDTVTDGVSTWRRTYTYTPSGPATDSGWVKQ